MRPTDMPPAERFEHGTRARYVCGCRCDECRRSNREYARSRAKAKIFHGSDILVPSARARKHLMKLSSKGIGRRSVQASCDVTDTILQQVKNGTKTQIRRSTEQKILSVTADACGDATLKPAARTWRMLDHLLDEGFSKAELARRLGYRTPAIQIKRNRVTAATEVRVQRFYNQIMAEGEATA